jgi:hypothetical protein
MLAEVKTESGTVDVTGFGKDGVYGLAHSLNGSRLRAYKDKYEQMASSTFAGKE